MRKIVLLSFISLDGIMQAPGGPDEDISGGFKYGGWTPPFSDSSSGKLMGEQMSVPFDLLLGRKTYDNFAEFWPKQDASVPPASTFNEATKFLVSHSKPKVEWDETILIDGDVVTKIKELKQSDGPMLQIHGSGNMVQTLLKADLIDELWLKIFPVTLGTGKKLFGSGTIPASFELISSEVTTKGIIFANYKKAGEVKTGSF
jgi:dihydrofolate reductase